MVFWELITKLSIFFISNDFSNLEDDYYILLKIAENLFTHTWSLCVEIQFYFMIPLVFYALSSFDDSHEKKYRLFMIYLLFSIISLIFYLISPRSTAFYSVFARIWQFFAGFLVYFWSEFESGNGEDSEKLLTSEKKSSEGEKEKKNYESLQAWLLLVTILMLFVGFEYPERIVRIAMTIITALLILIAENNLILSNKYMIYIGNISYSLYLIHWPIYCYSKFYELPQLPFLMLSIFLGILIYEFYEKWYTTKIDRKSQMILSTVLLVFCVLAIWRREILNIYTKQEKSKSFWVGDSKKLSLDKIMELNTEWTSREMEFLEYEECDYKNQDLKPFGLCHFKNLSSTAPLKILIIGNSYAMNFAPLILKACGQKSNLIWLASESSCDFLYPAYSERKCQNMFENPYETIQKMQFDYIFLISKCGNYCENDNSENAGIDINLEFAKSQIARIKNFVKRKIFIMKAVTIPDGIINLNKFLKNGSSFDKIDKYYSTRLKHHKKIGDVRHQKLAEFCGSKCEHFDAFENFARNPYAPEIFRFFDDRGLSYMAGGGHFPPYSWPKIQPIFDRICEKM
ncbi:unnamed protein product [Caenorhabditis angaria]|uniref:Acyl_transf_3 domain-containing protein n=1 Tax=Caenorhabditis angaria TaxID=860376 RepID=A0A9P1N654_9PELO|nr:unnamed protein product [Caenorhabditis angaria]